MNLKVSSNLTGPELVKALKRFGYSEVRQTGSHIRLETLENGKHCLTLPHDKTLRPRTLTHILTHVTGHFRIFGEAQNQFLRRLFE